MSKWLQVKCVLFASALILCSWATDSFAERARVERVTEKNRASFSELPSAQGMVGIWCKLWLNAAGTPRAVPGRMRNMRKSTVFVPTRSRKNARAQSSACLELAKKAIAEGCYSKGSFSACAKVPDGFNAISNEDGFREIDESDPSRRYYVTRDIQFSKPLSVKFLKSEFSGILDGGGHTLTDLTVVDSGAKSAGLFGLLGKNAVIRHISLKNVLIEAPNALAAGTIAGLSEAKLEDVTVSGGTVGGFASGWRGALVGFNGGPEPLGCSAGGVVDRTSRRELRLAGFQH